MPLRTYTTPDGRVDLKSLSLSGLESWLIDSAALRGGKERYRARQIYKWMWQRNARSFEEMTNVSKDTRKDLEGIAALSSLTLVDRLDSQDGTKKYLWRLPDGHHIESVLIPDYNRPGPDGGQGKPRLTL